MSSSPSPGEEVKRSLYSPPSPSSSSTTMKKAEQQVVKSGNVDAVLQNQLVKAMSRQARINKINAQLHAVSLFVGYANGVRYKQLMDEYAVIKNDIHEGQMLLQAINKCVAEQNENISSLQSSVMSVETNVSEQAEAVEGLSDDLLEQKDLLKDTINRYDSQLVQQDARIEQQQRLLSRMLGIRFRIDIAVDIAVVLGSYYVSRTWVVDNGSRLVSGVLLRLLDTVRKRMPLFGRRRGGITHTRTHTHSFTRNGPPSPPPTSSSSSSPGLLPGLPRSSSPGMQRYELKEAPARGPSRGRGVSNLSRQQARPSSSRRVWLPALRVFSHPVTTRKIASLSRGLQLIIFILLSWRMRKFFVSKGIHSKIATPKRYYEESMQFVRGMLARVTGRSVTSTPAEDSDANPHKNVD